MAAVEIVGHRNAMQLQAVRFLPSAPVMGYTGGARMIALGSSSVCH